MPLTLPPSRPSENASNLSPQPSSLLSTPCFPGPPSRTSGVRASPLRPTPSSWRASLSSQLAPWASQAAATASPSSPSRAAAAASESTARGSGQVRRRKATGTQTGPQGQRRAVKPDGRAGGAATLTRLLQSYSLSLAVLGEIQEMLHIDSDGHTYRDRHGRHAGARVPRGARPLAARQAV